MFLYSLPILFGHIRLFSPLEALAMLIGLWSLLFLTLPPVEGGGPGPGSHYLFSAWTGSTALRWVFWPFFLLLNPILFSLDGLAKSGRFTVSSWDDIHFILMFPIIWWTTSVWRCSVHTGAKHWAASARLATIAVLLEYGLKLVIRIDYPRLFFNCEDTMLNYGSCF
ncbi:MAG: hypothetical protein ACU841_01315 [Gammaproteobacteria bacterium]